MCGVVWCVGVAGVDNDQEHPDMTYAHTLSQCHRHVTRFTLTRARDDSQVHAHDTRVIAHAYTRTQVQEDTNRRACVYTARTHNIHALTCGNAGVAPILDIRR